MSLELESAYNSFLENKIPILWKKYSYFSNKPLSGWITDLSKRLEFFKKWLVNHN